MRGLALPSARTIRFADNPSFVRLGLAEGKDNASQNQFDRRIIYKNLSVI
jgi:hypothetical protein